MGEYHIFCTCPLRDTTEKLYLDIFISLGDSCSLGSY